MPLRAALKAALAALAGAMAVLALSSCSVDIGPLQHRTESYSVYGPLRTLIVNAHVGNVQVTGGNSGQVSVTEQISFRHNAPVTTHRTASGALTLDSSWPALESASVGYVIKVPRTMTVRVNDNAGAIRLESLSGQITAHTNAGNIDLASVSGPVEVTGHAGSIGGRNVSSARVTLRTSAGGIEITFSAAPATIDVSTNIGSITLRVPSAVSYNVHTSVGVGSARADVNISPASPHAITARTWTGSIAIEPAS